VVGAMNRVLRLRLGYVVGKVVDVSVLDAVDLEILRFVAEKYGGSAPLDEVRAIAVLGALAPRWREFLALPPQILDLVPQDLLNTLAASMGGKELELRLRKLEALGLVVQEKGVDGEQRIVLTEIGREVASMKPIDLVRSPDPWREFFERWVAPIEREEYLLMPGERIVVQTMESIELDSDELLLLVPSSRIGIVGIDIATRLIEGPRIGRLDLVLVGGYVPTVIGRGMEIAVGFVVESRGGSSDTRRVRS